MKPSFKTKPVLSKILICFKIFKTKCHQIKIFLLSDTFYSADVTSTSGLNFQFTFANLTLHFHIKNCNPLFLYLTKTPSVFQSTPRPLKQGTYIRICGDKDNICVWWVDPG